MRTKIRLEITLLLLVVCMAGCTLSRSDDGKRFDELQADFQANPEGFDGVAAVMDEILALNPNAERIAYTLRSICILPEGKTRQALNGTCRDSTADEELAFRSLNNSNGIVYQAKDGKRYFILYDNEEPPVYYVMYAPNDNDPGAFAKDREFRSYRKLDDDWAILGPMSDLEAANNQWIR